MNKKGRVDWSLFESSFPASFSYFNTVCYLYKVMLLPMPGIELVSEATGLPTAPQPLSSGQSYKQFTLVICNSRVVIWGIFQSGTTLES